LKRPVDAGRRWRWTSATCPRCGKRPDRKSEPGGIDILFANGGIQGFQPILEMGDADWHDQFDINLTPPIKPLKPQPQRESPLGRRLISTEPEPH
jgi:NAD(P)-dependent dehydrogenase (short-subunit alcohol dehydrogenase family)